MTEVAHAAGHEGAAHPGPRTYALIALVLSTITLIEFGAFYVEELRAIGLFMPLLIVLSAIKFADSTMENELISSTKVLMVVTGMFSTSAGSGPDALALRRIR